MTGVIFDIQRFSINDGPGIRTTVFLKGCPLNCLWCHNPEGIGVAPDLAFYLNRCIKCGRCAEVCSDEAILSGDERVNRERCSLCGECAAACPAEALRMIGREATVAEVLGVVVRDRPFYEVSGGGVTLSGGEPLCQYDYSLCLLKTLKEHGLHTTVDTCGLTSTEKLAQIAKFTDLFLYDVKAVDPGKHEKYCGVSNAGILENARYLAESGAEVIFRAPVVPGCNDAPEDIRSLGEFILCLPGDHVLELMPYHRVGISKYRALGLRYCLGDTKEPNSIEQHARVLRNMGVRVRGKGEPGHGNQSASDGVTSDAHRTAPGAAAAAGAGSQQRASGI